MECFALDRLALGLLNHKFDFFGGAMVTVVMVICCRHVCGVLVSLFLAVVWSKLTGHSFLCRVAGEGRFGHILAT